MHNKRALDRRLCRAVARLLVTMAWPPLGPSTRNTWQTRKQCARAALRRDFAHLGCAHANKLSPPLSLFFLSRRVHVSLSLSLLLFPFFPFFFFSLYVFQPTLARRQARCARAKYFSSRSRDYAATFAYCSSEVQPLLSVTPTSEEFKSSRMICLLYET